MMIVSTGEVPSAAMTIRFVLVSVLASLFLTVNAPSRAVAIEDRFQQAVNDVFTGRIDPENGPQIVDPKACAVLVPEPKFNRYARYHLTRFKMETARIRKKYAGSRTIYELEGDDTLLEYLKADKTTVDYGFRSAHIALPGDPDQTEKALALIFSVLQSGKTATPVLGSVVARVSASDREIFRPPGALNRVCVVPDRRHGPNLTLRIGILPREA